MSFNLQFIFMLVIVLSSLGCDPVKSKTDPDSPPSLKGEWVLNEKSQLLDPDLKIFAIRFFKNIDNINYLQVCSESESGEYRYTLDEEILKFKMNFLSANNKDNTITKKIKNLEYEVSKVSSKNINIGHSHFKRMTQKNNEKPIFISADHFCLEARQEASKIGVSEPPNCVHKCLGYHPDCFSLNKSSYDEAYPNQLNSLHKFASVLKPNEKGIYSLGKNGQVEFNSPWFFKKIILNVKISSTESIPFKMEDSNEKVMILTSQKPKLPKLTFQEKELDSDFGGFISKIYFIKRDPVFEIGKESCIHIESSKK